MTFKEVYKFPLNLRFGISKVLTADSNMAFDFFFPMLAPNCLELSKEEKEAAVAKINGLENGFTIPNLVVDYPTGIFYSDNKEVLLVRGWGHLTGSSGLGLKPEVAIKIQEEFASYIYERLSK